MKATLVYIDKNGNQKYKTDRADMSIIWLCGIDRVANVEIGDTGTMRYFSTKTRGYYYFSKTIKE